MLKQLIFYYVMGHQANANELTDRCKSEKNGRQNEQTKTRALTEGPLRHIIIATFSLHHCAIQLHATVKVYFKAPNFAWRRLQRFGNCIFWSVLNNCFPCTRILNDYHLSENNNNSLEVNATHILLCGGSKGQCN